MESSVASRMTRGQALLLALDPVGTFVFALSGEAAAVTLAGADVDVVGHVLHLPPIATTIAGAGIWLRLLALSRGWRLPIARLRE